MRINRLMRAFSLVVIGISLLSVLVFAVSSGVTITVVRGTDLWTADPHNDTQVSSQSLFHNIFDPLVRVNWEDPAHPLPALLVSGFRLRVPGFRFRVSGFLFQVPNFAFPTHLSTTHYSLFTIHYSLFLRWGWACSLLLRRYCPRLSSFGVHCGRNFLLRRFPPGCP